jgi:transposase
VSSDEVAAESQREPIALPLEHIVRCTAEECACGQCGRETQMIGYEQTEVIDVRPAEYFITVLKREKQACRQREGQGVHTVAVT